MYLVINLPCFLTLKGNNHVITRHNFFHFFFFVAKECNTEGDRCLSSLIRLVHLTRVSSCGTVFLDEQKVETHNPPRLHLSRFIFFSQISSLQRMEKGVVIQSIVNLHFLMILRYHSGQFSACFEQGYWKRHPKTKFINKGS